MATTPLSLTASEPGPPGNTNGSSNALGMGMGRFLTVPGKPSNRALGKKKETSKNPNYQEPKVIVIVTVRLRVYIFVSYKISCNSKRHIVFSVW